MQETKDISCSKLLKPAEIQEILGCGKNKIYQLLREGKIPGIRIGNSWRISPEELEAYLRDASTYSGKNKLF